MKVEIFSILDLNCNKNNPQMLPLYLKHYSERFPNCVFNIYLSNYPDNYDGDDINILKSKNCNIEKIKLGNATYISDFSKITDLQCKIKFNNDYINYLNKERDFKNKIWKTSSADWIIVCDIDELLVISEKDLENVHEDVVQFMGYNMVRNNAKSTLDEISYGFKSGSYDKTLLFRSSITDINFSIGSHTSKPSVPKHKINKDKYKLFHYAARYLDSDKNSLPELLELIKKYNTYDETI